jgi:hypothetical protein
MCAKLHDVYIVPPAVFPLLQTNQKNLLLLQSPFEVCSACSVPILPGLHNASLANSAGITEEHSIVNQPRVIVGKKGWVREALESTIERAGQAVQQKRQKGVD